MFRLYLLLGLNAKIDFSIYSLTITANPRNDHFFQDWVKLCT